MSWAVCLEWCCVKYMWMNAGISAIRNEYLIQYQVLSITMIVACNVMDMN